VPHLCLLTSPIYAFSPHPFMPSHLTDPPCCPHKSTQCLGRGQMYVTTLATYISSVDIYIYCFSRQKMEGSVGTV